LEQLDEQGLLDQALRIDARPSDAIAIALRVGCPIQVSEAVMDEAGHDAALLRPLSEEKEEEEEDTDTDIDYGQDEELPE